MRDTSGPNLLERKQRLRDVMRLRAKSAALDHVVEGGSCYDDTVLADVQSLHE